jgi:hypothetical protein
VVAPALAALPLGRTLCGDFECVAISARYVNQTARLQGLGAFNTRIPTRAPVSDARKARPLVNPMLKTGGHACIYGRHLTRLIPGPVCMDAVATGGRHDRSDDDLLVKAESCICRDCGAKRSNTNHKEIKRPRQKLAEN